MRSLPRASSPFARCQCANGVEPMCTADRHLSPLLPEVRRVREDALARLESDHVDRRLSYYVGSGVSIHPKGRVIA